MAFTTLAEWTAELASVNQKLSDISDKISLSDGSYSVDYMKTYKTLKDWKKEVQQEVDSLTDGGGVVNTKRSGYDD
jgi:hypothetical protein